MANSQKAEEAPYAPDPKALARREARWAIYNLNTWLINAIAEEVAKEGA